MLEILEDRYLLSASIFGAVWNDFDADGLRDALEPGLAGVTVFLDENQNGVFDSSTQSFNADSTTLVPGPLGQNDFASNLTVAGLPQDIADVNVHIDVTKSNPGSVLVGLLTPLSRTVGTGATLFFLNQGDVFFGTFDDQAARSIVGATSPYLGDFRPQEALTLPHAHVYDGDPNGLWQLVFLGDVSGITLNSWSLTFTIPEASTQTAADGSYSFTNLAAGTYDVGVVVPPAGALTFPASTHSVTVGDNQLIGGVDFGIDPAPDLVGSSFSIVTPPTDWGQPVSIQYTLTNQGADNAGPFSVQLLLSGDGFLDGNDVVLQTLSFAGLERFTSITGTIDIVLPGAPGTPPAGLENASPLNILLGFNIDSANAVVEGSETNNANRGAGQDFAFVFAQPNQAITTDAGVQQMPSVAVNPLDANHVVMAYMDYALLATGYAGLRVAVSHDAGKTWQYSSVPLPAAFAQGASTPTVRFDGQGKVYVSFMAATFPGSPENINLRGAATSAPELVVGQKPTLTFPFDPLGGVAASDERFLGLMANNGIFVARSDDGGLTWNAGNVSTVASNLFTYTGNLLQNFVFYDTAPDLAIDPNTGHLFVVWARHYPQGRFPGVNGTGGGEIYLAVSTDGGQTWQTKLTSTGRTVLRDPALLNANLAGGVSLSLDPKISIGPQGDIYVSHFAAGVFAVYHSNNGGNSFILPDRSILNLGLPFGPSNTARPPRTLDGYSFRTFPVRQLVADPVRPGTVYALEAIRVFNQFTGNQIDAAELNFAISTDHGRTWTPIFTVGDNVSNIDEIAEAFRGGYRDTLNDDNAGRFLRFDQTLADEVITGQALPKLTVDAQGNLAVVWYDTRRSGSGHFLDVFSTVSTDGGHTWQANFRVSDVTFDADAARFTDAAGKQNFFLGDLMGVAAAGNVVYAAWTDTRAGNQDIFFASYALDPSPAPPQDRFEANGTPGTATDLGKVVLPRILPRLFIDGRDEDWFRVRAAATGELTVAVSALNAGDTLRVELWDATGTNLLATGAALLDENSNVIGQKLSFAAVADQDFLIRVTGTNATPVEYSLTTQSLTADLGTQVQGSVAGSVTAGGRAIYELTPGATGFLELVLKGGANIAGVLDIKVLAADGVTVLASGYVEPNLTERLMLPVEAGKTVLLQVSGELRALLPLGSGSFTLDFTNFDQFNLPQNEKLIHNVELGTLAAGTANAVIPFTAQATGTIQAVIGTVGTVRRTLKLEVLGADGSTVLATGSVGQTITLNVEKGQQLLFRVSGTPTNLAQSFFLEYSNRYSLSTTGKASLFFPAGGLPSAVAIGDLNGDSLPDLVTSSTRFSDPINVLLANPDGTFQAPRRFAVGAGLDAGTTREIVLADFTGDGVLDIAVANPLSADVSLLIGLGDGTFQTHRRFDTQFQVSALAVGDFNEDGVADLVAGQVFLTSNGLSILLGRGDGTFIPQIRFNSSFTDGQAVVRVADFNGDQKDDVAVFGRNSGKVEILLGNGDGTFTLAGIFTVGSVVIAAQVADLNGDGKADIVTGDLNSPTIFLSLGNGDGTFQAMTSFVAGVDAVRRGVFNLAVGDFGSQVTLADGSTRLGAPDGKLDVIVNIAPRIGGGQSQLIVVPGLVNDQGAFAGFGTARLLAEGRFARPLAVGDVNGDGKADVAAADFGGVRVVYGEAPTFQSNTRDLGAVLHVIQPVQTIVRGHEDAFFALKVPADAAVGSGDQVIDFAALFQHVQGAGLSMEVLDANGNLLGTGSHFRVRAAQGATLSVRVFGVADAQGVRGAGAFSLIVDVLPQVVAVEAQAVLPGAPATSLVLTFQGDRLDPAFAQNVANYRITWLGPDGVAGTADDQVIPLASGAALLNPVANTQVSSGLTFPTAVRQTVTLTFDQPLPAGSYRVEIASLPSADLNDEEQALLGPLDGHNLVSVVNGQVVEGSRLDAANLVAPAGQPQVGAISAGTPFLTQLQNDLGALLDAQLVQLGDDPILTTDLTNLILDRLGVVPGTTFFVIWLDPVSIDLADARGARTTYNLQTNTVASNTPRTFVEVGGNVELVVMANVAGQFTLNVADVPPTARGGAIVFGAGAPRVTLLTDALRSGLTTFQFFVPGEAVSAGGFTFDVNGVSAVLTLLSISPQGSTLDASALAGGEAAQSALQPVFVLLTTGLSYGEVSHQPIDYAESLEAMVRQVLATSLGDPLGEAIFRVFVGVGETAGSFARTLLDQAKGWLEALPKGEEGAQNGRMEKWLPLVLAAGPVPSVSVAAAVSAFFEQVGLINEPPRPSSDEFDFAPEGAARDTPVPPVEAAALGEGGGVAGAESSTPRFGALCRGFEDSAPATHSDQPARIDPLLAAAVFATGVYYALCEQTARARCSRRAALRPACVQ